MCGATQEVRRAAQPAPWRCRCEEDLARRARRVIIRLACVASRCFWLSAAEVVVCILTDGDCLQSPHNMRIFNRQLQWAMQHCKRSLDGEAVEEASQRTHQSAQAVSLQTSGDVAESDDDDGAVVVGKVEAVTASTKASHDHVHRGVHLRSMCLYVYRTYVRRDRRPSQAGNRASNVSCSTRTTCWPEAPQAEGRLAQCTRAHYRRTPVPYRSAGCRAERLKALLLAPF